MTQVDFVRSNGATALAGCYLVNMLHAATDFSAEERMMENGHQLISLAGAADLESVALPGTSSSPLLRVPLEAILSDTPVPSLHPHDTDAHQFTASGPVSAPSKDADQPSPPQCLDPFVHHLRNDTAPTRK